MTIQADPAAAAASITPPVAAAAPSIQQPVVIRLETSGPSLAAPAPIAPTAPAAVHTVDPNAPTVESLSAKLAAMQSELDMKDLSESVMGHIDPKHAKAARAILGGLPSKGTVAARSKAAIEHFKAEFPEWMKPAEEAAAEGAAAGAPAAGAPAAGVVRQFPTGAPAPATTTPQAAGIVRNGKRIF